MWYQSPDGELYNLSLATVIYDDQENGVIKAEFPGETIDVCLLNTGPLTMEEAENAMGFFRRLVGAVKFR